MNFLILAGGEGSRLRQEGVDVPKPLVRINGEPMIGRLAVIMAQCEGAQCITVALNSAMPEVRQYLQTLRLAVPIEIIEVSTPSSMHTLYAATQAFDESSQFIATTVDTIFRPEEFQAYARLCHTMGTRGILMGVTDYIDDEKPLYVDIAENSDTITAFSDAPTGTHWISGGIYGLPTADTRRVLQQCLAQGKSRMRNFQRALLTDTDLPVCAYRFSKIIDVDHAADIAEAEKI